MSTHYATAIKIIICLGFTNSLVYGSRITYDAWRNSIPPQLFGWRLGLTVTGGVFRGVLWGTTSLPPKCIFANELQYSEVKIKLNLNIFWILTPPYETKFYLHHWGSPEIHNNIITLYIIRFFLIGTTYNSFFSTRLTVWFFLHTTVIDYIIDLSFSNLIFQPCFVYNDPTCNRYMWNMNSH